LDLEPPRKEKRGVQLVIWLVAFFVSILIHELGHALMFRRFAATAHIVLYAMGGPGDRGPTARLRLRFALVARLLYGLSAAAAHAAGADFDLLRRGQEFSSCCWASLSLAFYATGGSVQPRFDDRLPYLIPILGGELGKNPNLRLLVAWLLDINLYWPIINLLPVLPLDGGQIALQSSHAGKIRGVEHSERCGLSIITGGAMAVFALLVMQQVFTMMLFASLALSSYMTLQQMGGGGRRPW